MLQSGHFAAKSLISNGLTNDKLHFVGGARGYLSTILWAMPQVELSSFLTSQKEVGGQTDEDGNIDGL